MKRIFFWLLMAVACLLSTSCEKSYSSSSSSIDGKWYYDYYYDVSSPDDVRHFTDGEYLEIDGDTVVIHDPSDMADGIPAAFKYSNNRVTFGFIVWNVVKLTPRKMELENGGDIWGLKR